MDFLKWSTGEPSDKNGTMGEDCIDYNSITASWNDITCQPVNAYICKLPRGKLESMERSVRYYLPQDAFSLNTRK